MPASRSTPRRRPPRESRRYAAILSDCVLPDLPRLEWLAVVRGTAPTTALVVYSGAVHLDQLKEFARDWHVAAVLAKPFSPAQLVEAVRSAIATEERP